MGERKVLNKYIPADFDPKLVPRGSKPKDDLIPVRMMLPFTVQCSTCSDFMYRGRKFNSKKEPVKGSEGKYLGIQRWRFYIKCTACSRPVTFLTDPKNGDYEMESGGTRTYEVHKDKERVNLKAEEEDARTEKLDPMKALENRVLASQKEMADLDNLDEIKAMNMRHLKIMSAKGGNGGSGGGTRMDVADLVLKKTRDEEAERQKKQLLDLDEEDEALIKSIKFGKRNLNSNGNGNGNNCINNNNNNTDRSGDTKVIRLSKEEEEEIQLRREMEQKLMEKQQAEMLCKAQAKNNGTGTSTGSSTTKNKLNPLIKVKRKRKVKSTENTNTNKREKKMSSPEGDALVGLLGGYGSDDSDD
mmetsp:Transcript_3099/g.4514  ORF Transcript_3099/g.4514 Transcript_3099/m.4514 type:complete len:358 (+) Transcript_3099:172-1245(+)|eukprot:CAMPEP_0203662356 /NCGR_PEP_ID=MMETSP0090-20130426/346_1 /ASSEMBLY_ACC=CAM_ASM_001088 /TAXON_ID=426623 /ORGANISM="Chaetoceros affinis, Strain CCMP159" /LENGTH=357 /DNA_ID=CAMNT_0050525127 /DNA_START=130 /DNA_END=1203 /DNA_ORIENTATION=+